jgi:hypothetical protein
VAALIVPKNLGYAGIAGIPLQNGLYAAAAGAILYAVFGTSRQISTGPSSGLAAVAASAVAVAGISGIQNAASFVAGVTVVSGVLYLVLAVFKMGWIAQFLSRAVVTGFLFGAAIDVVIGELSQAHRNRGQRLEPAAGAVVLARDAGRCQPATADALGAADAASTSSRMMAMSRRLVKSGPHRSCCSARMTPTGCSRRLGGFMPSMGLAWRSPSATAHLKKAWRLR